MDENCDYLVDTMKDGVWHPTWSWGQYEDQWEESRKNWIAILTIKNYMILRSLPGWCNAKKLSLRAYFAVGFPAPMHQNG